MRRWTSTGEQAGVCDWYFLHIYSTADAVSVQKVAHVSFALC
jgi:hypothetical protein